VGTESYILNLANRVALPIQPMATGSLTALSLSSGNHLVYVISSCLSEPGSRRCADVQTDPKTLVVPGRAQAKLAARNTG
jgi:hypothetical protein